MSAEEQVERLAKVLGEHYIMPIRDKSIACACGHNTGWHPLWESVIGHHRAHVAQVLASLLDEAREIAWNEGWDAMVRSIEDDDPIAIPDNPYRKEGE